MVTNEAMTTMKQGMRTLSGMKPFSSEITKFDMMRTKVVAKPIDMPLMALVVVAKVGQQPNSNTKMGFSLMRPLVKVFRLLLIVRFLLS